MAATTMTTKDDALREANRSRAMNEVYWPRKAPTILPKDLNGLYRFAGEHIGAGRAIDYLEFGVAHGKSMQSMVEVFRNPESRFYGFDSFRGLPEKWLMHDVGAFSNQGVPPHVNDGRVSFIQGWFQNTVPGFLTSFKPAEHRPVLVHYDADLYSSTLFLLASLWPVVREYYFIFDDFIYDEVIALHDFMTGFPIEIQFLAQTKGGGDGPNPDQVFGHVRRIPLEITD